MLFPRAHVRRTSVLKLALLAVVAGGALCLARPAQTQDDPTSDLVLYRTSLDQIASGKGRHARLLLENSGPLSPENAALLAYLQEKEGDNAAARQTLNRLQSPTPLTQAYSRRLGGPVRVTQQETPRVMNSLVATSNSSRVSTSDARVTRLEMAMFRIVNAERTRNGLTELAYDDRLAEVSRAHSAEMRDKKYFAHESPTPGLKDPLDRYVAGMGATPRMVAENVYRAWGSRSFLDDASIQSAHTSLMNSPGHRANILQPGVNRIGIGLSTDSTGNIWITQMFARP